MKHKLNKRYIPFKKTIIPVLSIIMIIVAILLIIYTLDSKKFNKDHKVYDNKYLIHVYHLIMDEDKVPSDINLEKTFDPNYSEFPEGILSSVANYIPLTKKGDYLYADLDDFVNSDLINKETDYVFTNFNNNGEVIDGCEYDKNKNIIKVPVSYYENKDKEIPIQVEIQTLMKEEKFYNHELTVNVKKFTTKKVKTKNNIASEETSIYIGKYGPGALKKENIHIYYDNESSEMRDELYDIKNNKVVIYIPSIEIGKLDIKVDYSFDVFAVEREKVDNHNAIRAIKVNNPISFNPNADFNDLVTTFDLSVIDDETHDIDAEYCDNQTECYKVGGQLIGWRYSYANWAYTWHEMSDGIYADNYGRYDHLYVWRIRVSALLKALGTSLAEPLEGIEDIYNDRSGDDINKNWIVFYCADHSHAADDPNSLNFEARYRSTNSDNTSVTLLITSGNAFNNQNAQALLRFEWDNQDFGLGVRKTDSNDIPIQGLDITAFEVDSDGNAVENGDSKTVATNSDGLALFDGLDKNKKYKFYEDCNDAFIYDNHENAVFYGHKTADSQYETYVKCSYPNKSHAHGDSNGKGFPPSTNYSTISLDKHTVMKNNIVVGLRVKKTDDNDIPVKNLDVYAVNASDSSDKVGPVATNSNGIATFNDLDKNKKYKFYEDCSSTVTYDGHTGTLDDLDINCSWPPSYPLDDNGNGFTPTENYRTATPETMENIKIRHCVTAHKTKGTNLRNEGGVSIKLTLPANVCSGSPGGSIFRTTNANGIASFVGLGNCKATTGVSIEVADVVHRDSVLPPNPKTDIGFDRSNIKVLVNNFTYRGVTYNIGDIVPAMYARDLSTNTNAGKVVEECPTDNEIGFIDEDYVILWVKKNKSKKVNRQDQKMANVSFTVKQGNATIRVEKTKQNYTDSSVPGVTKSCYKYTEETGSNTTTTLVSDSNGETCIFNLPASGIQYSITEVANNNYDNHYILVTSSNKYSTSTVDYENYEYLIDWDKKEFKNNKTSNSDGKLVNTKFTVKDSENNAVKTKATKETVFDKNGNSKLCYVVDLITPSNNTNSVFESDTDGYTCIMGLKKNETYTVTETDPSKYYAYANVRSITEESKLTFNTSATNPKTIYQCPTEVKITKTTTELNNSSDEEKKLIYEELQKLTFNILDSNENVLRFKWNSATKHYEYQQAVNDLTGSTDQGITEIRLLNGVNVQETSLSDMDLNIFINYLPEGTYTLREVSSISCGSTSSTATDGSNCTCARNTSNPGQATTEEASCSNMGYGHVADIAFTVTDTNNGNSLTCDKADNSVKVSLTNKPTEVPFTKKDFYTYYNDVDTVKFENEEEIEAFDNITFKVRKKSTVNLSGISSIDSSVYEWFYKTADGEYRYDVLHKCTREGQQVAGYTCTQNLHTERGDLKLTHLCKCEEYYIEEYEVPDGSVFILPKLEGNTCEEGYMKVDKNGKLECHPIKGIKVCDCDDDNPGSSPPVRIEDLPTKQAFIKKDLKYNTIITDQRTTFELFLTTEEAEAAGRSCNPYNEESKARDCVQVYFSERIRLSDEADGSYSYRMHPNQSANDKVKELHVDPNTGKLIFRYLPSYIKREYVLMETKAPRGYDLPKEEKSVTRFKVANDTVNVKVSNVPNKPSKAIIGKYDTASGKLIPGVKFKIYKVSNYDENLTAMMQTRGTELSFKTIRDGSYELREVFDTNIITTCIDSEGSPCSDITNTLVDEEYETNEIGVLENSTTIQEGQALIQYLDTDTHYVIEEVEAPEGYKLPERESDRYTLFYVPESEEVTKETKIYNTETYFTFYKYDEYNQVKDGAVFKLQKLNKDKIYEDVGVEDVSTEDTKMYRVSSTSENYEITTKNGQATIYRLTEGQYRIIEIKAPEGYELPKKTYNVVTFLVDKNGHTYGSNIIANKKKTTKIEVVPKAQAELVVNIQTGQKVIKYGLIITGILGLISLLIFIRKKISK